MNSVTIVDRYVLLASELEQIIADAELRITGQPSDPYFVKNANFLTKSFLISLCCYLEVFLKELANAHLSEVRARIFESKVPHNLLTWSVVRDVKDKNLRFGNFDLMITPKDIDDKLSGNIYKTAECFCLLGIDLDNEPGFVANKEMVNSVISKRNSVIHHNDTAVDISLGDIRSYSSLFKVYVHAIANAASSINTK